MLTEIAYGVCGILLTIGVILRLKTPSPIKDIQNTLVLAKMKKSTSALVRQEHLNCSSLIDDICTQNPDKEMIRVLSKNKPVESFTRGEFQAFSFQVARYLHDQGIKYGDSVALVMESNREYIAFWMGIARIGGCTALINFNLKEEGLNHAISLSKPKAVIVSAAYLQSVKDMKKIEAYEDIKDCQWFTFGCDSEEEGYTFLGFSAINIFTKKEIKEKIYSTDASETPFEWKKDTKPGDNALLIYTSGTTGFPKAARVPHWKIHLMRYLWTQQMNLENISYSLRKTLLFGVFMKRKLTTPDFKILPIYHSAAGVLGVGSLFHGGLLVLRDHFSASLFVSDIIENDINGFQYIGEIARYLTALPKDEREKDLKITFAIGNGLRPDIWDNFQKKFNIERIIEFYASTEGNANLVNLEGKRLALGLIPPLILGAAPIALVKFDFVENELERGKDGRAIRCKPGEVGQLIGLVDSKDPSRRFEGYTDKKETEKKLAKGVFKEGDVWFLTGDALTHDKFGYFYWSDRLGDTFRWKSENVATAEVAETCNQFDENILETCVYGVEVPHNDGRAGMACIVLSNPELGLNFQDFHTFLFEKLPKYAVPQFIRMPESMNLTNTFKHKKYEFQKEGFDPEVIEDPIFMISGNTFIPLDGSVYKDIQEGKVRF